jgi:hypothetical protein
MAELSRLPSSHSLGAMCPDQHSKVVELMQCIVAPAALLAVKLPHFVLAMQCWSVVVASGRYSPGLLDGKHWLL